MQDTENLACIGIRSPDRGTLRNSFQYAGYTQQINTLLYFHLTFGKVIYFGGGILRVNLEIECERRTERYKHWYS